MTGHAGAPEHFTAPSVEPCFGDVPKERTVGCQRAVIALDVGGTKLASGIFRDDGQILFRRTVPTPQSSADDVVARIVELVDECVAATPVGISAAGVGVIIPGWVNRKQHTVWAPNVAGWDHYPLRSRLTERLALPIVLDSDRSGYVLGEAWLGVARGIKDVVFLSVGTGIGAGIIADGRILHGAEDLAGAAGWLAMNPEFREEYCRMGCFEAEASGTAAGNKATTRLGRGTVGPRELFAQAAGGNDVAASIVEEIGLYLGMGVANLVSILNPQMVVLGGGMLRAGAVLLEKVRSECRRWAQPISAEQVRIELSLLGDGAGLAGAARIALENV